MPLVADGFLTPCFRRSAVLYSDASSISSLSTFEMLAVLQLLQHKLLYPSVLLQMPWLCKTSRSMIFIKKLIQTFGSNKSM